MIREDEYGWPDLREEYRLDRVLKMKADQGVKIYVLLWNETKIAVELNSLYSKTQLERLSTGSANVAEATTYDTSSINIKVIRHPVAFPVKVLYHQNLSLLAVVTQSRYFPFSGRTIKFELKLFATEKLTTKLILLFSL